MSNSGNRNDNNHQVKKEKQTAVSAIFIQAPLWVMGVHSETTRVSHLAFSTDLEERP